MHQDFSAIVVYLVCTETYGRDLRTPINFPYRLVETGVLM